jgi:AAA+ superfamily predicted ATPase
MAGQHSRWSHANREWLIETVTRLRLRLETQKTAPGPVSVACDSVEAGTDPGFTPALIQCAHMFGLSPFERELLLLVAGLELDSGLRAAVSALNGGASVRASYGLALGMLVQPHWDALSPDAPLRYWRLVEPEPGAPLAQANLRIDERILHFLTGVAASDAHIQGIARYVPMPAAADLIDGALAQRISQSFRAEGERGRIVVLYSEARDPCAQRDLALTVAAELAQRVLWIAAQDLPSDVDELTGVARRIDREIALTAALPVLAVEDSGSEPTALAFAARLQCSLLWLGAPNAGMKALPERRRVLRFEVPAPNSERTRLALTSKWSLAAASAEPADEAVDAALGRAAAQFRLTSTAMDEIVDGLIATIPCERSAAVWTAAREAARGGLDALAQRIVTKIEFDDLVLPVGQIAILRDIARHLRNSERVYRDWGFGDKHARGKGLTALFAGESGTGKTLAAEAIANEVKLDLYRVDLAMLVSKYIGETEKNLKRLFDAAEASGAVLLFDEADALFGKRSEVKDSHDRYANIEVSYLLQRIEAYRGLAILTTNMKSALDRAFLRRIRFVIQFPFPDAPARERIWRRQFPAHAPLGNIDFTALSRLNLAGGHIHSIALNAAFKAADGTGSIDQSALMEAARAEYAKLERSFTDGTGGAAL